MVCEPFAAAPGAALRVLVVDDDRVNALLFAELCRVAGGPDCDCDSAASAAEALERVAEWAPDLLVVDRHLPDADGCELLPRLRLAAGNGRCLAYLCTADPPEIAAEPAAAAGFDGCWTKPVAIATLAEVLRRLAGVPPAAAPGPQPQPAP